MLRLWPGVIDERGVDAKAERLVERARRFGGAVDDRLPAPLLVEPPEREGAHGRAEAAAAELLPHADGLELTDAVCVVEPAQAVGGEAAVRRLDDTVERVTIGPLRAYPCVARLGEAGGCPHVLMDRDPLREVVGAGRSVAEPRRERRRLRPL